MSFLLTKEQAKILAALIYPDIADYIQNNEEEYRTFIELETKKDTSTSNAKKPKAKRQTKKQRERSRLHI